MFFKKDDIKECYYFAHMDSLGYIFKHGILSRRRREKAPGYKTVSSNKIQDIRKGKILERNIRQFPQCTPAIASTTTTTSTIATTATAAATVVTAQGTKRPRGLNRHANLYINPCNAMMLDLVDKDAAQIRNIAACKREDLCILRISNEILNRGDIVISNKNAAASDAKFYAAEDFHLTQEETACLLHPEAWGYRNLQQHKIFSEMGSKDIISLNKQVHQAEVLAPYVVQPAYIVGVIVNSDAQKAVMEGKIRDLNLRRELPVTVNEKLFFPQGIHSPGYSLKDLQPVQLKDTCQDHLKENSEPDSSDSDDGECTHKLTRSNC
jgi:hypothetical protein